VTDTRQQRSEDLVDTSVLAQLHCPHLAGVEPAPLWTLYNRAAEAARPDGVLDDDLAIELFRALAYPAREVFGDPQQPHALRAVGVDRAVRRIIGEHPGGTVVSLGDGLDTGFWRVDDGRVRWLSVDLPEVIALRDQHLPRHPRLRNHACSALDPSWMDEVDTSEHVLIVSLGLLMHFEPDEALGLIAACAERFPGGHMIFDHIPPWFSLKTRREAGRPGNFQDALPFALSVDAAARLPQRIPRIASVTRLEQPAGRASLPERVVSRALRLPVLSNLRFSVSLLEFARTGVDVR
jgi:O-methyltransferase involved in polyketide biosynthesis